MIINILRSQYIRSWNIRSCPQRLLLDVKLKYQEQTTLSGLKLEIDYIQTSPSDETDRSERNGLKGFKVVEDI